MNDLGLIISSSKKISVIQNNTPVNWILWESSYGYSLCLFDIVIKDLSDSFVVFAFSQKEHLPTHPSVSQEIYMISNDSYIGNRILNVPKNYNYRKKLTKLPNSASRKFRADSVLKYVVPNNHTRLEYYKDRSKVQENFDAERYDNVFVRYFFYKKDYPIFDILLIVKEQDLLKTERKLHRILRYK